MNVGMIKKLRPFFVDVVLKQNKSTSPDHRPGGIRPAASAAEPSRAPAFIGAR